MDASAQSEVIDFLGRPEAYGPGVDQVERIDTHGAVVFLAGERAYKLKRAVKYSYLDYSTVEKRRRLCEAELALNRRTAPELYLAVEPVTRDVGGGLSIGGTGEAVDWLVTMRRFDQADLLDHMAARGALDRRLILALADRVVAFHRTAEPTPGFGGRSGVAEVLRGDIENLMRGVPEAFNRPSVDAFAGQSEAALARIGGLLDRRREQGKIRRCHGDLHLRNICLVDGVPTLFDCIEFNDRIACIDVLYDLAFLLMDLDGRGLRNLANAVLNRYFDLYGEAECALAVLPQFLSQRAAIRAHVGVDAAAAQPDKDAARRQIEAAQDYLVAALGYLRPTRPRLVAIGGLSGTGKSTLAYGVAPVLDVPLGARVLRTDMIRKRLAGVAPEAKLPKQAYTPEAAARVYQEMGQRVAAALAAGHAVIADAVFARPDERRAIAALAGAAGVPFTGLWLDAPAAVLEARVAGRQGDASDATVDVLRQQLGYDLGELDWRRVDVSGDPESCLAAARAALG